jgi:hypothetical protein
MTPAENNLLMRKLLMSNSPLILKKLPTVTGAFGGTTRIKLNNTGLVTRLYADIHIPYNASVAPTAIGNKSVYAAIPKVQLIDFDGSNRINTTGFHLALRNAVRGWGNFGNMANLQTLGGLTTVATGHSNDFREPQILVSTTGATELRFVLEIPVAADVERGDLRGILPAQFVSGDLQLAIDFASSLTGTSNDDFVFSGGTMTTAVAPYINVYQEYYLPQKVKGILPIPQDDINTVYELGVYSRTTDNIAAGQEKLVNFPIVREVNGVFSNFINNSLLGGGSAANGINTHTIYANGNNIMYQADDFLQNHIERTLLKTDLPMGVNVYDFSNGPISTAIFANVQLALTPQGTMTSPAVETSFESFYAKGSALSGAPV